MGSIDNKSNEILEPSNRQQIRRTRK